MPKKIFDIDLWRQVTIEDGYDPDRFRWVNDCIDQEVTIRGTDWYATCVGKSGRTYFIHKDWIRTVEV